MLPTVVDALFEVVSFVAGITAILRWLGIQPIRLGSRRKGSTVSIRKNKKHQKAK